ncbi:hypothetical protein L1987_27238 [Smallanthus sonchifolius]|uniref:Uncharacterized protein n=1 Tax=Smallanthus sonchifolius TaxID=185202 RepID=A0ACB9ICC9_9ASTR|nr:hypothetical protein L1987_27238 [Smallanthus sonchifolius]
METTLISSCEKFFNRCAGNFHGCNAGALGARMVAVVEDLQASITFNFTYLSPSNKDIILSGDAAYSMTEYGIQVTYNRASIGLPLDFRTNTSLYPFVAVEFDTYGSDDWDPINQDNVSAGDHVGININSLTSVRYLSWVTNTRYGKEYTALINYDSDSKVLSVSFTSYETNLGESKVLDHIIDLKGVLPEWVIFGFSASTGDRYETHVVKSWTFNSTEFKVDENNGKTNMLLKMGLTTGMLVLVTVLAIFAYFFWRKKNNGDKAEEIGLALEMNNEFEMGASMPRRFSYLELARSTADFAETEKFGEGGFGAPIDNKAQERQIRLLEYVWELYGTQTLLEAVDSGLGPNFEEEEIKRLMIVGLWCVHPDSELRPSMRQDIKVLNSEAPLPLLPSKMPMASYLAPPGLSDFCSIGQYESSSSIS